MFVKRRVFHVKHPPFALCASKEIVLLRARSSLWSRRSLRPLRRTPRYSGSFPAFSRKLTIMSTEPSIPTAALLRQRS